MRYLGAPAQADPSGAARAPASPLVPLPCPCRAGDAPPVPLGRANVLQVPASSQALPAAGIPRHLWHLLFYLQTHFSNQSIQKFKPTYLAVISAVDSQTAEYASSINLKVPQVA